MAERDNRDFNAGLAEEVDCLAQGTRRSRAS